MRRDCRREQRGGEAPDFLFSGLWLEKCPLGGPDDYHADKSTENDLERCRQGLFLRNRGDGRAQSLTESRTEQRILGLLGQRQRRSSCRPPSWQWRRSTVGVGDKAVETIRKECARSSLSIDAASGGSRTHIWPPNQTVPSSKADIMLEEACDHNWRITV